MLKNGKETSFKGASGISVAVEQPQGPAETEFSSSYSIGKWKFLDKTQRGDQWMENS